MVRFNEVDSPLWRWRVEITRTRRRRSEYRGGDEEDDSINLYQYQWQRSVVVTRRGVGAVGCVVCGGFTMLQSIYADRLSVVL